MPDRVAAARIAAKLYYLRQHALENDFEMLAYILDMAIVEAEAPTMTSKGAPLKVWADRRRGGRR